jgi:CheY-like chemotaxis protein
MTHRILIVEDDLDLQRVISQGLKSKNCEVEVASNGAEALKKVIGFDPDVVLLDVMMPVMDGYECCEKLRGNPDTESLPVIFLTARDEDWDILRGYMKGCDGFLKKPFQLDMLIETIEKVLSPF